MATAAWDIDRIVDEVVKRLREDAAASAAEPAAASRPKNVVHPADPERGGPRELVVADRVVSLAALDGRLAGIGRLVTRRDAVITPSARDEVNSRGIELVRGEARPPAFHAEAKTVLVVVGTAGALERSATELEPLVGRVDRFAAADLPTAIRQLAREVTSGGRPGVLLTDQPVAAHCLANHVRGVRAAWAVDLESLRQAVRTIGANLLVVDVNRGSVADRATLVQEFVASGDPACPGVFAGMAEQVR
jgi:ribose 5-phosphate isomerase RpiB